MAKRSLSGLIVLSRYSAGSYQRNELTRSPSGNARPQLSQLAEPMWSDPSLESGTDAYELISTPKKKKKERKKKKKRKSKSGLYYDEDSDQRLIKQLLTRTHKSGLSHN